MTRAEQDKSQSAAPSIRIAVSLALGLAATFGFAASGAQAADTAPSGTLSSFHSDSDLERFLKRVRRPPPPPAPTASMSDGVASMAQSAQPAPPAEAAGPGEDQSITNTQEVGVDEGGIVKMHGDKLVMLRRGRVFTVSTKDGELNPIDSIDAFPPGVDASADWYDEMLVSDDRVVVIGFSYGRGGTEINRFRIDGEGHLSFEDAYHLRSNDYYSSRNYASRLIGNNLIFYSPLYLGYGERELVDFLPALSRWSGAQPQKADFKRIINARHIYVPENWRGEEEVQIDALHTVTTCDLSADVLNCDATSVLGPAGRNFYVSSHAVYVWVSQYSYGSEANTGPASLLYRMPLDGSAPSAVGVRGAPTDQFSFREDWNDGMLNVLVRSESAGDAMWRPEFSSGSVALLRLPLNEFGDGSGEVEKSAYRTLPRPESTGYGFQNRFVGDYVLYGTGNSWGTPTDKGSVLLTAKVAGDDVSAIPLPHGVDRIEAMGRDAVVIGSDQKALYFSAVELTSGDQPVVGDRYMLDSAAQGETRSHAFFFKPSSDTDGVLGLPVARAGRPGYQQLTQNSAAMIFLRRSDRKFANLGELAANDETVVDDHCKASCVDWYGNARPIFLRNRTFALMGYELVEGNLDGNEIKEVRRLNFAPKGERAAN